MKPTSLTTSGALRRSMATASCCSLSLWVVGLLCAVVAPHADDVAAANSPAAVHATATRARTAALAKPTGWLANLALTARERNRVRFVRLLPSREPYLAKP